MTMGPIGLTGLKNWDAKDLPGMQSWQFGSAGESMAVRAALGYKLEPVFGLSAEEFAEANDATLIKAMETLQAHWRRRA